MFKNRQKIKILTMIRYPIGGIRTYLKYIYGNLDKTKYQFTILTVQHPEINIIKEDLKDFDFELIEVKGKKILLSLAYNVFLVLLRKKIDIIHSQGSSSGIIVSVVNTFFKVPHIITFHETFSNETLNGRLMVLKTRIISFLFSQANFLVLVSNDAKQNLLEYFSDLKKCLNKIIVIHNGVDTAYFCEDINDLKNISEIDGIDKNTFVIGYLGRFMPEKGFPVLINAIEKIAESKPTVKFKILSLGGGAYIREYQALIKEKGLKDYFVFIEFQSDVRWVLRGINLLVIPSLREAFPLLPIEALVSGTPIVASNCIGLREVLIGTPARMFKTGDPNELADAIMDKMNNTQKKEELDFVLMARRKFDLKDTVTQLELLFEKGIRNKKR